VAYIIVKIFGIRWDYAVLKMYGILVLYDIARPVLMWPITKLNYSVFLKRVILSEMNHYLRVFNTTLNDDSTYTYDTYLLEAAFDETEDVKMRVLAAINYGAVVDIMSKEPKMDSIYWRVWCEALSKFTKQNPERVLHID
jgi:hypothetical protein